MLQQGQNPPVSFSPFSQLSNISKKAAEVPQTRGSLPGDPRSNMSSIYLFQPPLFQNKTPAGEGNLGGLRSTPTGCLGSISQYFLAPLHRSVSTGSQRTWHSTDPRVTSESCFKTNGFFYFPPGPAKEKGAHTRTDTRTPKKSISRRVSGKQLF